MGNQSWLRLPNSGGKQFRQPRQIADHHRQRAAGAQPFDAAVHGLGQLAGCLGPAKRLLDLLLSASLRLGLTLVPGGCAVDGGGSGLLGDMRRHHHLAQFGDEVGAVVATIRCQGQTPGRTR